MTEEQTLEVMFDFKQFIPAEIYSSAHHPFSTTKSATAKLISFDNSNNAQSNDHHEMAKDYILTPEITKFSSLESGQYEKGMSLQKRVSIATRSPSQAQEHLMAERKRRQNLSQLFITLSKLVPGLKKLDKASLLEDGINYLKSLEERVRVLEEEERMKKEDCASHKVGTEKTRESAEGPEIQARISDKHVLIKIFCSKHVQKDLMSRIAGEMEKIQLNVMDMRVMLFGGTALDVTILAQMQSGSEGTVKDIVDHLHTLFLKPRDNIT